MNMMQMVGIMVLCYFTSILALSFFHKYINVKLGNTIFIIADLVFFFAWNYAAYQRGWLESGFMTLGNISPFIMTLIPFTVLLSDKVREFCNAAIAFLWMGMFFALMISPEHAYIFNYNIEANFLYASEAACHLLASVYGFYLMISGQVKCDIKNLKRSIICMFSVITFGVLLNYIFHLNNFGMDPYGEYSIYMIDIFASFEVTLLAYYLGVFLVLTIGMQAGYGIQRLVERVDLEGANSETAAAEDEPNTDKDDNLSEK
ncbi:MAG: hypothetical protein J6K85_01860 [Clostridia bacterium]|nr:hypothetical protein [Clostridia bacterium]